MGEDLFLSSELRLLTYLNSPHFMEPEGSLPHSQVPANCPYHDSARSSPYTHIQLPEDPFYYYPPIYAWVSKVIYFLQVSPPKPYILRLSPIRSKCPAHLILLDFISRKILGEQYRSFSSSLCNFLHSPITSSLLGPNILLSTLFSNMGKKYRSFSSSLCSFC
jgi:hypothetical protein